ncbi:MAG: hypothetical protein Q8Q44_19795, partial [Nocardioides sp.]|nr:hypothetical protein [Nocardioides sp.]
MTNAQEDFSLDAELAATEEWDEPDEEGDGFESGYADPAADLQAPDPEEIEDLEELTVGAQDLAERHALRRVAGLSTELEDITEVEYRQLRL